MRSLVVLAGRSNPAFAQLVVARLGVKLGKVRWHAARGSPRHAALATLLIVPGRG